MQEKLQKFRSDKGILLSFCAAPHSRPDYLDENAEPDVPHDMLLAVGPLNFTTWHGLSSW